MTTLDSTIIHKALVHTLCTCFIADKLNSCTMVCRKPRKLAQRFKILEKGIWNHGRLVLLPHLQVLLPLLLGVGPNRTTTEEDEEAAQKRWKYLLKHRPSGIRRSKNDEEEKVIKFFAIPHQSELITGLL